MKVNFYTAKTNNRKTEYAVDEIVKRTEENIILITPEQISIEMQVRLVKKHKNHCIGNIAVLNFARLAHNVNNEFNTDKRALLSDIGKDMLISKLLNNDKYEYLRRSSKNKNFLVESIRDFFQELSRYIDNLDEYEKNLDLLEDKKLCKKLKITLELYRDYQKSIESTYMTGETALELLIRNGYKSDYLKDSIIYLDGFVGFTPLQIRILEMLFSKAKEVNLFFNVDKVQLENKDEKSNLYYETMITYMDIKNILSNMPDVFLDVINIDEVDIKTEKETIVDNLFSEKQNIYKGKTKNIFLSDFSSKQGEVETIVSYIAKLLREEGCRYKDFTVYVSDMALYGQVLEESMNLAKLPYYMDRKDSFDKNDAISFVFLLLNLYSKDFDIPSVSKYLKSYFANIDFEDIYLDYFENYLLAYNKRGLSAFKNEWTYKVPHLERDEVLNEKVLGQINIIRQKIYDDFSLVKLSKKASVKEYIDKLNSLLRLNEFEKNLELRSEKFDLEGERLKSDIYSQIYDKLNELLEQLKLISGDEIISLDDFIRLLDAGKSSLNIGHIPSYVDQIIVGDSSRSKIGMRKYVFVLGLNDDSDLKVGDALGFLNDYERQKLDNIGVRLAPTKKKRNVLERYYVYDSIVNFGEKLFLSYLNNDDRGNKLHKSYTVKEIKKIFPNISSYKEYLSESDYIVNDKVLMSKITENSKLESVFYDELLAEYQEIKNASKISLDSFLSDDSREKIFSDSLVTSVSRLEKYASCPQAFFLNYILALSERSVSELATVDVGNANHYIFEMIIKEIIENKLNYDEIDGRDIDEMVEKVTKNMLDGEEYSVFSMNYASMGHFSRLKKQVKRSLTLLIKQISRGEFRPRETEMSFSYTNSKYKIDDKRKINIIGKIDRLDEMDLVGVKYLSVVDYKTSVKNINFNKVYSGLNLQLLVYLSVVRKIMGAEAAGVQYYPVYSAAINKEKYVPMSAEDRIKEKNLVTYLINDDDVIKGYDKNFDGSSNLLKIKKLKSGAFRKTDKVFEKDDFETILDFVDEKVVDLARNMVSGDISVRPYKYQSDTACDFCSFKGICKFNDNTDKDSYNTLEKKEEACIIDMMRDFEQRTKDEESN